MRLPARWTVLLASFVFFSFASAQGADVLKEGDVVAQFSVTTDQGKHMTSTDFGGKLLVLNFCHTHVYLA